jgi:hypothetical protein
MSKGTTLVAAALLASVATTSPGAARSTDPASPPGNRETINFKLALSPEDLRVDQFGMTSINVPHRDELDHRLLAGPNINCRSDGG